MQVGVVSRSFPDWTNAEVAEFMKAHGFPTTELCLTATDSKYWNYNGVSDLSDLSDARFSEICATYRARGIELSALGVFTNLIEPDDSKREVNLDYFRAHIRWAGLNGIPIVSTECGFDPEYRGVRTTAYVDAFDRLKDSLSILAGECERWDVSLALEPCVIDIVPSAKRARDILDQVGSPRLKILLDPANLIANSSEEDMFSYLADRIAYFHGKDRKVNDVYGRAVGDGDIDWPKFLSLYHKHCAGLPFILEYVTPDNVAAIRDRVLAFDAQRGAL